MRTVKIESRALRAKSQTANVEQIDGNLEVINIRNNVIESKSQCCGSGSGIRSLFNPWILDPGWVKIKIIFPRAFWVKSTYILLMRIRYPESFGPWFRDPVWKNSDPGSGINIPHPQHPNSGPTIYIIILFTSALKKITAIIK
jgi:hypothetical protein